jgi:hypothetical protein
MLVRFPCCECGGVLSGRQGCPPNGAVLEQPLHEDTSFLQLIRNGPDPWWLFTRDPCGYRTLH